ncbi:universal stress protein [Enterococcus faecalis]|uniref:universal stress protein n=1 Tax=Enterococcus TaxID=1350 RepID=UPI0001B1E140|nr:universal stress protein [Enterococcus faecalis]AQL53187.1 universal stress protein UspA [Enterococcus faecalis]AXG88013.1 universal stress protein [Enterococcus faecalis]AYZ08462.1 universal stress protein [Enterococcus faecalis]EET99755.1 nucleotide-binding protein [Enterococcus faecalis T2]EFM73131.1 universal stress family protein [Enterococcus faecalis TX0860]
MKFSKIMVGVEESPDALKAFHYAIQKAKEEQAELVIVSILEEKEINVYQSLDKNYWQEQLAKLEKQTEKYQQEALTNGIDKVSVIVNEGNPGELIINKLIPLNKPDLLIIGSKSTSKLKSFFGSQAAYMARYAPISVMIIR